MSPAFYRLVVVWDQSVTPDGSFDPAAPQTGCLRDKGPCAPWAGLRAQLEAVAAMPAPPEIMVVPMYTPARYARPPAGCEAGDTQPRARPPRFLHEYRAMIRAVNATAAEVGVRISHWSPWNEPNHPHFLSPQRVRCDAELPSAAVPAYSRLAQAMQGELEPGQSLVLGELAATPRRRERATAMTEFVAGLPRALICAAPVFSVHEYAPDHDGEPIEPLAAALAAHGCEREHRIWVTETGARNDKLDPGAACAADRANLERWYEDPRVDVAFHYTVREDDLFPTGLVTTALDAELPVLAEWRAWAARADPTAPPPPPTCDDTAPAP